MRTWCGGPVLAPGEVGALLGHATGVPALGLLQDLRLGDH